MTLDLSPALVERLQAAAAERGVAVEDLLERLLDTVPSPTIAFPTDLPRELFYQLAELSPTNLIVVTLEGQFRYVNPMFCEALGYTPEYLAERAFIDLVHPEDRSMTEKAHNDLLATGRLLRFVNRYVTASGEVRYFRWHATASVAQGLVFAVSRDVTDELRLEREAQEKADQITSILESVTDAFFSLDRNWRFIYLNSRAEDLLDRSAAELIGRSIWDAFSPAVGSTFYEQYKTAMQEQVTVSFTEYYAPLNTWFEVRAYPSPDMLSVYFRDVTREREQEQRLRDSEALFSGILNSQIDLVSRYLPDTTLTYVNDAYASYFGYPREQLIGRRFLNFEGAASADEILARLAEVTRDPTPDVRILSHIDANGRRRWIQWLDFGIQDVTDKVVEIQAVGRDITALYETRQILEQQKEMLQTVFDHIPVMIILYDPDWNVLLVNQAWLDTIGWTVEEMQATPNLMQVMYPDEAMREAAITYMRSGEEGWREFTTMDTKGNPVHAEWANVRLSDGRMIGIGRDVSARRALQEQRMYAEQLEFQLEKDRELIELKDRFAGTVSHEFRTPLAVVLSSVELIQRHYERMTPERLQTKLTGIARQTERMVEMLDNLLAISRGSVLQVSEFAIEPFCQHVFEVIRLTMGDTHVFHLELDENRPQIMGDRRMLEHAFINLVSNAVKYSLPESNVQIRTQVLPEDTLFFIRDEGIGIPPEDLPRLFEPFHRSGNAEHIPGTGLGLAIVKQYIEMHNGSVEVESAVGKGTEFRVRLPLDPTRPAPAAS